MKPLSIFLLLLSNLFAATSFPTNFQWCLSTAAHQIEGNNIDSDWWHWEKIPGKILDDQQSGPAVNHWNMVKEDIDLLTFLNATTYRFSISWAKVEPRQGQFDMSVIAHYQKEINLLIQNNIKPMITLFHFVLPQWLAQQGGWTNSKAIEHFVRFSTLLYSHFGDKVEFWITLNEPMVYAAAGHLAGIFPPGYTDANKAFEAGTNMLTAHARVYHLFHSLAAQKKQRLSIGIAHHMRVYRAYHPFNPLDLLATFFLEKAGNWAFRDVFKTGKFSMFIPFMINKKVTINDIKGTQDFFGLNYYSRDLIKFSLRSPDKVLRLTPKDAVVSDLNWEIYPEGLEILISKIHKKFPNLPIIITENGIADQNDIHRPQFITAHLQILNDAIKKGIDIRGYCHWSLMDNFEWAEGRHPRFGLFDVDYQTFRRIPRPSAYLFRQIAKENSLP